MAYHATNRGTACRSDTAATGQYRAAYGTDAGADGRIFVATRHIAAPTQHGQCAHRNGNDRDPVNCSHDSASVKNKGCCIGNKSMMLISNDEHIFLDLHIPDSFRSRDMQNKLSQLLHILDNVQHTRHSCALISFVTLRKHPICLPIVPVLPLKAATWPALAHCGAPPA